MPTQGEEPDEVVCSAKGCRQPARHVLVWNNPKLHTPGREKTWVACDEHRGSLSEYLDVRGFLRRVDPLERERRPLGPMSPGAAHVLFLTARGEDLPCST